MHRLHSHDRLIIGTSSKGVNAPLFQVSEVSPLPVMTMSSLSQLHRASCLISFSEDTMTGIWVSNSWITPVMLAVPWVA